MVSKKNYSNPDAKAPEKGENFFRRFSRFPFLKCKAFYDELYWLVFGYGKSFGSIMLDVVFGYIKRIQK